MELLDIRRSDKKLDFDYVIRDYKDIYFIKYDSQKRLKKTIGNILKVSINVSGRGWEFYANKMLMEYRLQLDTVDVLSDHIFYCKIQSYRSINKNKIILKINNDNRFSDLD